MEKELQLESSIDFSKSGYIRYSISPSYDRGVAPGETVTISGVVRWNRNNIKSIGYTIPYGEATATGNQQDVSIAKGTEGKFSISFIINERCFDSLKNRINPVPLGVKKTYPKFGVYPWNSNGGGSGYNYDYSVGDVDLVLIKYRIAPKILAMDFERATPEGKWADDGQYLQCKTLKIAINPQAVQSDITKATITCTGTDGSSRSVNLTQEQLAAALTSDGYSETVPGIFSDFVSALGVDYTLTLTLGDDYDQTAFTDAVMRSFARLHFSGAKNGGVAVGMFSSSTDDKPKFEVSDTHESHFYGKSYAEGGIEGVSNYAEGEVKTGGHWIDGKPIYRYGIALEAQSVSSTKYYPLPFTIDTLLGIYGGYYVSDKNVHNVLPNVGQTDDYAVVADVYNDRFRILTGKQRTISRGAAVIEYTKAAASDPPSPDGPEILDEIICPDAGVARADYIAMMAGIEIPTDAEAAAEPGAQSDPNGMDSPGIDGAPAPSAHYETVERYYKFDCWSAAMVKNAVGKWITEAEANKILKDSQTEGE